MNTTSETLDRAIHFLRQGWTKGVYARDADGRDTMPLRADAVCFCALGAIQKACGMDGARVLDASTAVASALSRKGIVPSVARFNDNAETVDEVIEIFEQASRFMRELRGESMA